MDDLLKPDDVFRGRWIIVEKLGQGAFGQIYRAKHYHDVLDKVAIKVMTTSGSERPRMELKIEATILKELNKLTSKHFCTFYEYGEGEQLSYSYLVMSMCSKTLSDLRRGTSDQRFSPGTAFRIGVQALKALSDLHALGWLHRDIKASNFMTGRDKAKTIFMIDFGLARRFVTGSGEGQVIKKPREYAGFRGTVRYASITTHRNQEMGRKDDLWSLFYMMVEFLQGELPWRRYSDREKVVAKKVEYSVDQLAEGLNEGVRVALREFSDHLEGLLYESKPNYVHIKDSFAAVLSELKVQAEDKFDWESGLINLDAIKQKFKDLKSKSKSASTKSKVFSNQTDRFDDGEIWDDAGEDFKFMGGTESPTHYVLREKSATDTAGQPQDGGATTNPNSTQSTDAGRAVSPQPQTTGTDITAAGSGGQPSGSTAKSPKASPDSPKADAKST